MQMVNKAFSVENLDLFTMSCFSIFFIQTTNKSHNSIKYAAFSNLNCKYEQFHKNLLQTGKNMGPQPCIHDVITHDLDLV